MMLIEYSGALCVVGLDWETSFDGQFTSKQLVNRGKQFKASFYVAHAPKESSKMARTYGFGTPPKLSKAERKQSIYSLASVLARDRGDSFCVAVALGEVGENGTSLYSFMGILEGQPASGFDIVGTLDEVRHQAQTFMGSNSIGQYYFLPEFGDPELNFQGVGSVEFETESGSDIELSDVSKLVRIPSGSGVFVLLGLSLAILGGMYWMSVYQEQQEAAERAKRTLVTPEKMYLQTRDAAFKNGPTFPANSAFPLLAYHLFALPPKTQDGWALEKAVCDAIPGEVAAFKCPVTWIQRGGTYDGFVSPIEGATVRFDPNLALITTEFEVRFPEVALLRPEHFAIFPQGDVFLRSVGTVFQDLGLLGFVPTLGRTQAVGALTSNLRLPVALYKMDWALRGPVDQARRAISALPPSMAITKVEVMPGKADGSDFPTINISGVAYVR